jgi:hypothetical protein
VWPATMRPMTATVATKKRIRPPFTLLRTVTEPKEIWMRRASRGQCEIGFLQDGRIILLCRSLTALSSQSCGARCGSMGAGENSWRRHAPGIPHAPKLVVKSYLRAPEPLERRASDGRALSALDCPPLSQSALRLVATAAPSLKANHEPVVSGRATPTMLRSLTSIEVKSE